jgi:hypothetical protein
MSNNDKIRRGGKLSEGLPLFHFFHLTAMAYGASQDDFTIIGIAIGSLIVGSILGREPKRNGLTRVESLVLERRIAARERRLALEGLSRSNERDI